MYLFYHVDQAYTHVDELYTHLKGQVYGEEAESLGYVFKPAIT